MIPLLQSLAPFAWPAVLIACVILAYWRFSTDLHPIVVAVVKGIADNASRNSLGYGMAILLFLAASLQELAKVSDNLSAGGGAGWQYVSAAARVLQPGLVAVIAFLRPSPAPQAAPPPQQHQPQYTS